MVVTITKSQNHQYRQQNTDSRMLPRIRCAGSDRATMYKFSQLCKNFEFYGGGWHGSRLWCSYTYQTVLGALQPL